MKEIPILFSTPMVQAIFDDRKSQTRRIIKNLPLNTESVQIAECKTYLRVIHGNGRCVTLPTCKYLIGDILWVRETWFDAGYYFIYRADSTDDGFKWKPSIFMPRIASRLKLKVTNIRVERVQDITEEDAIAEGISLPNYAEQAIKDVHYPEPSAIYADLWESINGKDSWKSNPWVWVICFERIK